jgi:hypothetical protein
MQDKFGLQLLQKNMDWSCHKTIFTKKDTCTSEEEVDQPVAGGEIWRVPVCLLTATVAKKASRELRNIGVRGCNLGH